MVAFDPKLINASACKDAKWSRKYTMDEFMVCKSAWYERGAEHITVCRIILVTTTFHAQQYLA